MSDPTRDQLIAYLATLGALVIIVVGALIAKAFGVEIDESLGFGMAVGGLIGVLRLPQQRSVTVDNPANNPVQTEDARA